MSSLPRRRGAQRAHAQARCRAFSMVELLVVLVIIAVMAALSLGVVNKISDIRRETLCVNNLRQLSVAMRNRINDQNQTLRSFYGGAVADELWSQTLFLEGYLNPETQGADKDAILTRQIDLVGKLTRCPAGPTGPSYQRDSPRRWGWQTYGLGMYDSQFPIKSITVSGKTTSYYEAKMANIAEPSRAILFADSSGVGPEFYQTFRITSTGSDGGLHLRHRGHANAVFLDGHISRLGRVDAIALGLPDAAIFGK